MQPKPEDYRTYFVDTFKDHRAADAYRHRPPYPDEVFDILANLITDEPRAVLDIGAGSGDIARGVVDFVESVSALSLQPYPHGCLALVYRKTLPRAWDAELKRLHAQFLPQGELWQTQHRALSWLETPQSPSSMLVI